VLGSNVVDYITVTPGQKCAVLQGGTAGTIAITDELMAVARKKVSIPTLEERVECLLGRA